MQFASKLAPILIALAAFGGCGESGDDSSRPGARKPQTAQPSFGVQVVKTCADLTGQDVASTGAPLPEFVRCLKQLNAPRDVIDAWTGG